MSSMALSCFTDETWNHLVQISLNDSSPQVIYQNVKQEVTEGEVCDEPKCCDGPCDQSCDHEEEEQPLMKTNNYQFC